MYRETVTRKTPSTRNREIFRDVRVKQQSLREVAKGWKLSAGRVSRICKQVEGWIGETAGSAQGTNWQQRLFVMEEIHRQRLDLLFQQALAGWAKSQEDQHIHKLRQVAGKPDVREVTVKSSAGDRRFLETALKIEESRRKFEEESEQIQNEPVEQAEAGEEQQAIANCELGIAKGGAGDWGLGAGEEAAAEATSVSTEEVTSSLAIPNQQLAIGSDDNVPTPTPAESHRTPSPAPAAKQPVMLQTFHPTVMTENRRRALIHPSERPPREENFGIRWG